jgi:hypothetical protein
VRNSDHTYKSQNINIKQFKFVCNLIFDIWNLEF